MRAPIRQVSPLKTIFEIDKTKMGHHNRLIGVLRLQASNHSRDAVKLDVGVL